MEWSPYSVQPFSLLLTITLLTELDSSEWKSFFRVLLNVNQSIKNRLLANRQNSLELSSFREVKGNKTEFLNQKKDEQAMNTNSETLAFSVLFNNLLFLLIISILAFFILPAAGLNNTYNYVVAVSASSAIASFISITSLWSYFKKPVKQINLSYSGKSEFVLPNFQFVQGNVLQVEDIKFLNEKYIWKPNLL